MHDNDPEITVLIPGIIGEPGLQEKYVNHSKESIHEWNWKSTKPTSYVKVQMTQKALGAKAYIND